MTGTQQQSRSAQPETRRRNDRGAEKRKKLLTEPERCDNLYKLSLKADREGSGMAEKKNKKVLDKAKEI